MLGWILITRVVDFQHDKQKTLQEMPLSFICCFNNHCDSEVPLVEQDRDPILSALFHKKRGELDDFGLSYL
jgi:hypothetical protein